MLTARSIFLLIGLIIIWQLVIISLHLPPYILPPPYAVLKSFLSNSTLIILQTLPTLLEISLGLLLGISLGSIFALIIIQFKPLRLWLLPILLLSQALPVFVLAPLLIVWLGYGLIAKIIITMLMVFFPITSTFFDGLRRMPSNWLDMAQVMNATPWRTLWHIRVPNALPHLASGIRLATVAAPMAAIISEWVGASSGLGYLMLNANARLQMDLVFACLFAIIMLALALYFSVDKLLRHFIQWQLTG